ncbi:MAG: translation initiation factor IF-2 N-terminal domain-containing protein, partial [Thermodesulfobacteriota bacterium]|nr:translation initiation factor IF-2 N-terminal domain-containing protein [Thermodesulfobacteriota bacterium]
MGKVRIYELAKELGMANKELVQKLQGMGFAVKSHSSTIEDYRVREIKDRLLGRKSEVVMERRVQPTVIRRRKKIVDVPRPEQAAQEEGKDEEPELRVEPEQILEDETPAGVEELKEEEEAPVEAALEKTEPKAEEEVLPVVESVVQKPEPALEPEP